MYTLVFANAATGFASGTIAILLAGVNREKHDAAHQRSNHPSARPARLLEIKPARGIYVRIKAMTPPRFSAIYPGGMKEGSSEETHSIDLPSLGGHIDKAIHI